MPDTEPPEGFSWVWNGQAYILVQTGETAAERRAREQEAQRLAELEEQRRLGRVSARQYMLDTFRSFGFQESDIPQLSALLDQWIMVEGLADVMDGSEIIMNRFRQTDIYARRFTGMKALRERGQAISEAEYIGLERGYRAVLSSYGLPSSFYDSPEDYGQFIANQVSVNEVQDRVDAATRMLDSTNPSVLNELGQYYGVDRGGALAYLLDANKAQKVIKEQVRAAQLGGAAEQYGFKMDRAFSESLGDTSIGQTLDPFNSTTQAQLDATFAAARRTANRDSTLASIDNQAFSEQETLRAEFGDDKAKLASEQRAKRERARFSGTSGVGGSSLSVSRNL